MRTIRLSVTLVVALVAVACGTSDASPDGSSGATLPSVTETSSVASTTAPGTTPVTAVDAPPEDLQQDDPPVATRLSIEDALLPPDALAAPWEPQRREVEWTGYGAGPNQTDCDEYWRYESLLGGDGGHAMWWVDGGNANHHVIRLANEAELLSTVVAVASIAESCPVVRWHEGGSFTTELIELEDAIALRFDDEASAEVTWVIVTAAGDLVSLLQIPLWARADGTMIDLPDTELRRLGALMYERLEAAEPEEASVPPPITAPPPITEPPPIIEPVVEGLGALLLDDADLTGWRLEAVRPAEPSVGDDELVRSCPAASSIDRIDAALEWHAEYSSGIAEAFQGIGSFAEAADSYAVVRELAGVAECDFGVVLTGATAAGGAIEVVGGDVASLVVVESPDEPGLQFSILAVAVDAVVVVFSVAAPADSDLPSITRLAELGVAKVRRDATGS